MTDKVSIIIPAYNSEKYIREAVESALMQTYNNIEVIVVNDGSTDGTRDAVADDVEKHGVKYIYQENSGPGAARNAGIGASSGEYIAFLDHDDSWSRDKIEKQVRYLERNPEAAAVFCDGRLSSDEKRIYLNESLTDAAMNYYRRFLESSFVIFPSSLLIRGNAVRDIGPFDERLIFGDDYDFMLRAALRYDFGYIDECLYNKTVSHDNLTNSTKYLQKEHFMHLIFENQRALCPENHRRLFNKKFSKLMYMSARKYMSAMQFFKGIKVFGTAVSLRPRYLRKLPGLLVRYTRFCLMSRVMN